ncbi:CBS domain-containing protein [Reichenbachiella sp. MALMAid0571]|uniref:CBS domain-containing protein n=1 Tax=Reichenbachiella sp. MALMAid0571 TaxID=3143939 RepID=UPI0032E021F6
MEVLDAINDGHFTTEHARFNMEINIDPIVFKNDCLYQLEKQIGTHLQHLQQVLSPFEAKPILTGILPTIRRVDLDDSNLTPSPRHQALSETMAKLRGESFEFRIVGADELITRHISTMFEGCNTSFQVHLQVNADNFVEKYNWAQAIAGPVLACCTNSPLLLGKRLWRETRIALFQQSVDTRRPSDAIREQSARVTFGNRWLKESLLDIYREDVARYRVLVGAPIEEDALSTLREGKIPQLKALRVHNGTIYKWNRACYGISDNGKPHLRIENRYIPAGPSIVDQVANAAFWLGLMNGLPEEYKEISRLIDFDDAKTNFLKAARTGMGAQFKWTGKRMISSHKLILEELLPIACEGLRKANVRKSDIDKYLTIIKERVTTEKTGSQWILDSFAKLKKEGTKDEALVALTAGIYQQQNTNRPVHKWDPASIEDAGNWMNRYSTIEQIMSTDLFTAQEDDQLTLVASIMDWRHIRHVPVENTKGELKGLITSGLMVHYLNLPPDKKKDLSVQDIMVKKPVFVSPETTTIEAIDKMRKYSVGCLPVVKQKKLVGIVTEHDFVNISERLLNELNNCNTEGQNKDLEQGS